MGGAVIPVIEKLVTEEEPDDTQGRGGVQGREPMRPDKAEACRHHGHFRRSGEDVSDVDQKRGDEFASIVDTAAEPPGGDSLHPHRRSRDQEEHAAQDRTGSGDRAGQKSRDHDRTSRDERDRGRAWRPPSIPRPARGGRADGTQNRRWVTDRW